MRILILLACGAALLAAQSPQNGRSIFEKYGCYQCHGREAQGGLGTGPRLGPEPIGFIAFQRYLRRPTGQMPPYTSAVVSDTEIADIYSFVQSVKEPPAVKDLPPLPGR